MKLKDKTKKILSRITLPLSPDGTWKKCLKFIKNYDFIIRVYKTGVYSLYYDSKFPSLFTYFRTQVISGKW